MASKGTAAQAESSRARTVFTRTEDLKVHDLKTDVERSNPKLSPLSKLPGELRAHIYSCIFHDDDSNHKCKYYYNRVNDLGCRCGQGLSRTNYFFYNETRARYYQGARFVFKHPGKCQKFLDIGRITKNIGHLSVACGDNYQQSSRLWFIFEHTVNLRSLHLQIEREGSYRTFQDYRSASPPLYGYSFTASINAAMYDLKLRPRRHPLGHLKFVRSLSVFGEPCHEIEEAIVQLTQNMYSLAKKEGKTLETKPRWQKPVGEWLCEINIIDLPLLEKHMALTGPSNKAAGNQALLGSR